MTCGPHWQVYFPAELATYGLRRRRPVPSSDMHLRSVGVRPEFGVSLDDFRTVGRVELGCEHLMTISRQHIEFSVNNARNGSTTVRALHPNPIRVFRNGEAEGALLSKLGTTTAKLRAGDLIEIGDVRGLIKDGQVFTFRLCSGTYQPATTTSPGRPAAAAAPPPAKRRCSTPVAAAAAAAAVPPDDSVPQEAAPLAPAAGAERETELAAAAPQHEVAAGVKPQGASIHTPMTLPGAANGAAISGGELATKQLTKPDYPSSAAQEPRRLSRDLREATESDPRVPANGSQSASLSRNQPQSAAIESDARVPLRQSAEAAAPSADAAAPSEEAEDVVVEDAAATSDAADAADAVDAATATMLRASAQRLRAEKGAKEVAEVAEAENVAEAEEVAEAAEAEEVEEAAEWEAEMAEVEAEDGVMYDDERAQHHYALSALFTSPPSSHLSALLAREQRRAAQAEAVIASVLAAAAEATAELEAQVAGSAKDDDAHVAMTMAIDEAQVAMTMAIDDAQVAMTDADVAADAAIVAADATVHVGTNEETAFAQEPVEGVLVDEAREEMVRTKPSDAVAGADADADVVAAAAAAAVEAEAAAASDADAQAAPSQAAPSQAAPSQAAPSQADAQAAMKAGAVAAAALESTSAWAMQDETPPLDLGSVHDERAVNDETSPLEFGKSWDDGPIALVATVRGYGVAAGLEGLQAHASPRAHRAAVSVADTLEPLLGNEPEDDERPPAARAHKHWNAALARAADLPHTASTRMPLQSPLPSFGFPSSAALVTTLWPANAFSCAVGGRVLSGPIATAIQTALVVSQHAVTPIVAPTSTADAQYGAHIGIGRKRAVEEPSAETSAESSAEPSVFSTASGKAPRLLSGFRGSGERRGGA